jgi:hypothetical protein
VRGSSTRADLVGRPSQKSSPAIRSAGRCAFPTTARVLVGPHGLVSDARRISYRPTSGERLAQKLRAPIPGSLRLSTSAGARCGLVWAW